MKWFHLSRGIVGADAGPAPKLPLHVLPAFEAAARHGSFRAAAAELHLTPSAISHQIRLLEEAIGVSLFERLPRGLELTDAGQSYARTVSEVLARLQAAAEELAPKLEAAPLAHQPAGLRRASVRAARTAALSIALTPTSISKSTPPWRWPTWKPATPTPPCASDRDGGASCAAHRITELFGTVVAAPELAAEASCAERTRSAADGLPEPARAAHAPDAERGRPHGHNPIAPCAWTTTWAWCRRPSAALGLP